MQTNFYSRKLQDLEALRHSLARKIDASYQHDEMTDFLLLQSKYEETMRLISSLRSKMHTAALAS